MGQKKTIKLVKQVLNEKSHLYTEEELIYMKRQLTQLKEERKAHKQYKKAQQGFGYVKREADQSHDGGG